MEFIELMKNEVGFIGILLITLSIISKHFRNEIKSLFKRKKIRR
jgi:hypothetical protein